MNNLKKIISIIIILSVTSINTKAEINDSIFATVGNKVITRSDIVNEIKIILISTGQQFSADKLKALQAVAVKALIKRNVKRIEIDKYSNLQFSMTDLQNEIIKLADSMDTDIETLKNTLATNEIGYEDLIEIYKTELLWNSLIFDLYKNSMVVNKDEVDEQLSVVQDKKEIVEYLVSEIIIPHINKNDLDDKIKEIKSAIKIEGFENVALKLSISESALEGGDIGWIDENILPKSLKTEMERINVGDISQAIVLPEGILIFKIRDKRKVENKIDIEEIKNQIIKNEKTKILNMHSLAHYDKLRRTITIKYY